MTSYGTPESILTALRYTLRDDDGMLNSPVTDAHIRPYVYLPGHNVHAGDMEIHLISIYPVSGDIEALVNNGYTVSDGPLIDLIRAALDRD